MIPPAVTIQSAQTALGRIPRPRDRGIWPGLDREGTSVLAKKHAPAIAGLTYRRLSLVSVMKVYGPQWFDREAQITGRPMRKTDAAR